MARYATTLTEATHRYPCELDPKTELVIGGYFAVYGGKYQYVVAEGVADAARFLQKDRFAMVYELKIEKNMGGGVYDHVKPATHTPAWGEGIAPNRSRKNTTRPYDPTKDAKALLENTLKRRAYNQDTLKSVSRKLAQIVEREVKLRCK